MNRKILLMVVGFLILTSPLFAVTHGILGDVHPTYRVSCWYVDSSFFVVPGYTGVFDIGTTSLRVRSIYLSSSVNISGNTGVAINLAPAATGYGLKIHTHSSTAEEGYANEFKGEFVSMPTAPSAQTQDGVKMTYNMHGSTVGAMRSLYVSNQLDAGYSLTGTDPAVGGWMSAGLFYTNIATTAVLNGTAVTVNGIYSGIETIASSVITTVSHLSGAYIETRLAVAPTSGSSEILFLNHSGAGKVGQAIYISGAGGGITHALKFASGDKLDGAYVSGWVIDAATTPTAMIKIDIAGTNYYVPCFNDSEVDDEWAD